MAKRSQEAINDRNTSVGTTISPNQLTPDYRVGTMLYFSYSIYKDLPKYIERRVINKGSIINNLLLWWILLHGELTAIKRIWV
jgi:hypothetical protein